MLTAVFGSHLLPRLRSPVRPGPNNGSNSRPFSPVIAKSKRRLCSTCCRVARQEVRKRDDGDIAYQLGHALLRLLQIGHLDAKVREMLLELRVEPCVVADVAVDVLRPRLAFSAQCEIGNGSDSPAVPSGAIVPILTLTG